MTNALDFRFAAGIGLYPRLKMYNICATHHGMQKYCWMRRQSEGQKVALLYVTRSCQFHLCKLSSSPLNMERSSDANNEHLICMHISSAG